MQTNSLYIASVEPNSGSFSISMGLMELLTQNYQRVAFFKPIAQGVDNDCLTMIERYGLKQTYKESVGFESDEFLHLLATAKQSAFESLIQKFENLKQNHDFVLVVGVNRDFLSKALEYDINYEIAKNFSTPFVPVFNAVAKTPKEMVNEVKIETNELLKQGCELFCAFINMVEEKNIKTLQSGLDGSKNIFILPKSKPLEQVSVSEVQTNLRAKQLYGKRAALKKVIGRSLLVAGSCEEFLQSVQNADFVVIQSSRIDIVLAVLSLITSKNAPKVSGVLLVGKQNFNDATHQMIKTIEDLNTAILQMEGEIYEVFSQIKSLKPSIGVKNKDKIDIALNLFFEAIDPLAMQQRLLHTQSKILTPLMFSYQILSAAKKLQKTIILPESEDERILRAAGKIAAKKIAKIILVGNPKEVLHKASNLAVVLEEVEIIEPQHYRNLNEVAQNIYEKRKHKGLTYDQAVELAQTNYTVFATSMVDLGLADGMVSGAVNSTADTIRPALQIIKTKQDVKVVSSVFFICLDTRVLVYGDCAINKEPSSEELADIAMSSAQTAQSFGIEPKVAMLSYSSGDSGSGQMIEKVKQATQRVQQLDPSLQIEGPIQYDAAIDAEVAKKKLPHSKVAGNATVFIFPDLNSGNNTYKAVQRSTGALAIGPVLQGLNKPVNDLSRGCSVEDIVNTIAITAIQAGQK